MHIDAQTRRQGRQPLLPGVGGVVGVRPNNLVNRTQIPLRGLCAGYLGR
jgi:hypothetical protein